MIDDSGDRPDWYKDAVIYELHVRAFGDSDGDGIGDFDGLTAKLDYLQQLGVTALWLLPFYPSPLRDDGYDIADYGDVNPSYGDLRSFRRFLKQAHRRGLRVITELVLNHTSDQHPWFQRARRAKPGSRWRDFYVWNDTPDRYPGVRVIFEDYETSNWTWDPLAGAYYWHRFFSHQPDLNFDNPEVRATMLRAVDRWLQMGVDGVRLDAVPYLFERDGTNCENLPETHEFLKELRSHVDSHFPNRMLLAEANQWPEDAVAYFGDGDGDECHTAFHFPLMPRLFMALRMEDRFPVIDILQQTPDIPGTAQWAIFLRNHDELTLEMVTDEERDYMYRAYAADPQMRVNVGIRRRLAPLMQNDRRKIELLNAVLFALPGTPVLYYGDELGMGDNVYLGDRDSVRTPMQWSPDRNAGFSTANPQRLFLPVIIDPEYHYETVNVEAQDQNPNSLLWWMRRLIALRAQHRVFGRGDIEFLYPENGKVLAFVRRDGESTVLVVANLSRFATAVTLDLHEFRGQVPVELFGATEFAPIHEGPYQLTLGPHGFYWFALESQRSDTAPDHGTDLPVLQVPADWHTVMRGRGRAGLERALPAFLARNRWYAGKARSIRAVETLDVIPVSTARSRAQAFVMLSQVEYTDGEPETYVLPLAVSPSAAADQILVDHPNSGMAFIESRTSGERWFLHDAVVDPSFMEGALDAIRRRRTFTSIGNAELRTSTTPWFRRVLNGVGPDELGAQLLVADQSNSSAIFGNRIVMKMFRRAQEGVNPDLEIGRYLTEAGFPHTAPLLGALEYQRGVRSEPRTVGVLYAYVPNEGDAWHYTLDQLSLFYESALQTVPDEVADVPTWVHPVVDDVDIPVEVAQAIGPYLDSAELLGRRTAELHRTLAAGDGEAFAPEPFTTLYQRSVYQSMRSQVRPTLGLVRRMLSQLDDHTRPLAESLLERESEILDRYSAVRSHRFDVSRIRVHGDFHLGQVLHAGRDFVIIDFEGEPSRSPTERRIKRSAITDVAGMIRSFQYAVAAGLRTLEDRGLLRPEQRDALTRRGAVWEHWVTRQFLRGYLDEAAGAAFVPTDPADLQVLLVAYTLDKALYEVRYELNNRPTWADIPLRGVQQLLEADVGGSW
ncbi:MAG TPA: maltose alpha-D-glucosyltransferase [Acidimicrobiales bacterium]